MNGCSRDTYGKTLMLRQCGGRGAVGIYAPNDYNWPLRHKPDKKFLACFIIFNMTHRKGQQLLCAKVKNADGQDWFNKTSLGLGEIYGDEITPSLDIAFHLPGPHAKWFCIQCLKPYILTF